jgi:hypothetical protein
MRKANFGYSSSWHAGKRLMAAISLSAVLSAVPPPAGAQVVNSTKNPNQIAILHSYGANQTTAFAVGKLPGGVAFDGANIWVSNHGSTTVTKLRASDGATLGTFAVGFSVGFLPGGLAFDGANILVANTGQLCCKQGHTVTKLRASDGRNLGTFAVGTQPNGLTFDGANMWVANFSTFTVTKLRASDGTNLGTFTVGTTPMGVAFDGANIWVTNNGDNTVSKL